MSIPNEFLSLQDDLRAAMAVELTTMPPYLYSYWSIKPLKDGGSKAGAKAARTIMSVILEEMLHMGLGANVLNALGGSPAITEDPYLPYYPGPLLRHSTGKYGFNVYLRPLSIKSIHTFLEIELPKWDVPTPPADGWATIGQFYQAIEAKINKYGGAFSYGKQLPDLDNPGVGKLIQVNSKLDALRALELIVDQGEGTSHEKYDDGEHELAHYWKFMEIEQEVRSGTLDLKKDVYPVITITKRHEAQTRYTDEQQRKNGAFNIVYSELLDTLQTTLTSEHPDVFEPPPATNDDSKKLGAARRYMDELGHLAAVLRNTGYVPKTDFLPGPTFDYIQPANR